MPVSAPTNLGQIEADRLTARAANQVKRCYTPPRVSSGGLQIVTRLRVHYAPDGTLAALPVILSQSGVTPRNAAEAGRMAQAAIFAVVRCPPLRLPADQYEAVWKEFDLTFSPKARV